MIHIKEGDITKAKVDCIINPANGLGVMDKGVSNALSRAGGPEVENSSKEACFYHGLYKPGEVYWGDSGFMLNAGIKKICHAVVVYRPTDKPTRENIGTAIIDALVLIRDEDYTSCAAPAIGNSPRGITARETARNMMFILDTISGMDIHIIDRNKEFIDACKEYKGKVFI